MKELIGQELHGYRVERHIGRGGMGHVYYGIHPILEQPVAIKVLHEHMTDNKETVDRFINEVRTQLPLQHDYVAKVYHLYTQPPVYAMIMEYIKGVDLNEILARGGPIKIPIAVSLFRKILRGLNAAHDLGIIHRDIKPSNILVTSDWTPKICDFGIAKVKGQAKMTMTGMFMGTPHYVSPEAAKGKSLDPRSDIYSLGCCFFEVLTGHPPYEADDPDASPLAIVAMHFQNEIPDPRKFIPQIPPSLVAILRKAMAKEPSQRFENCSAFDMALYQFETDPNGAYFANELKVPGLAGEFKPITEQVPNKSATAYYSQEELKTFPEPVIPAPRDPNSITTPSFTPLEKMHKAEYRRTQAVDFSEEWNELGAALPPPRTPTPAPRPTPRKTKELSSARRELDPEPGLELDTSRVQRRGNFSQAAASGRGAAVYVHHKDVPRPPTSSGFSFKSLILLVLFLVGFYMAWNWLETHSLDELKVMIQEGLHQEKKKETKELDPWVEDIKKRGETRKPPAL